MYSSKPSDSAPSSGDDNEMGGADPRSKLNNDRESVEFPKMKMRMYYETLHL